MTIGFRDGWMRHDLRYHPLNIGLLYKGAADRVIMEDWCRCTAANISGHSLGTIALQVKSEKCKVKSEAVALIPNSPLSHLEGHAGGWHGDDLRPPP